MKVSMVHIQMLSTALVALLPRIEAECTEEQLNIAKMEFKTCIEEKKAYLLKLDSEKEDDIQFLVCKGLKELSTGCTDAVDNFSYCMGREHVDHLVAIHLNAFSDILAPFHPSLNLRDCPVFKKPPPPVIHKQPEPEPEAAAAAAAAEPEYEPITASVGTVLPSLLVVLAAVLLH